MSIEDISSVWSIAVAVYDALEKMDGNRQRANRFHCDFMRVKDDELALVQLVEQTVVLEER